MEKSTSNYTNILYVSYCDKYFVIQEAHFNDKYVNIYLQRIILQSQLSNQKYLKVNLVNTLSTIRIINRNS